MIVAALAAAWFVMSKEAGGLPPAGASRTAAPLTPTSIVPATAATRSVVPGVAATSTRRAIKVTLTEDELSTLLRDAMVARGATELRELKVKLLDGATTISGIAPVGGFALPVEADALLKADRGMLAVEVSAIRAAGMDLPEPLRVGLIDQLKRTAGIKDLGRIDLGIDVTSVQVTPGKLLVEGTSR